MTYELVIVLAFIIITLLIQIIVFKCMEKENKVSLEDFDKLICLMDYPPYAFINTELPKQIKLPDNFYVIPRHSKDWYKWFRKEQIRRIKNEQINKRRSIRNVKDNNKNL